MSFIGDFSKILEHTGKNQTYSLRLITDWLKNKNIEYTFSSPRVDPIKIYEHGIRIDMGDCKLSIQTHPSVAGWAFAETLKTNDMLNERRHKTPEDLFNYIEEIIMEKEKQL